MIIKAPTDLIEGRVRSREPFDVGAFLREECLQITGRPLASSKKLPRSARDHISRETPFWVEAGAAP